MKINRSIALLSCLAGALLCAPLAAQEKKPAAAAGPPSPPAETVSARAAIRSETRTAVGARFAVQNAAAECCASAA